VSVVELSSPPAGIHLFVGGDTNNGFARGEMPLSWYAAVSGAELSSPPALSPLELSVYSVLSVRNYFKACTTYLSMIILADYDCGMI